ALLGRALGPQAGPLLHRRDGGAVAHDLVQRLGAVLLRPVKHGRAHGPRRPLLGEKGAPPAGGLDRGLSFSSSRPVVTEEEQVVTEEEQVKVPAAEGAMERGARA